MFHEVVSDNISLENPDFKGCSWQVIAKFNENQRFNPKVGEGGKTQSSYKSQTIQNTQKCKGHRLKLLQLSRQELIFSKR